MNTCVIIAEYNPFHNGHAWQIAHARELGAKNVVVIMSGNFVERGTPALFPKQCRTAAALCCGADMVIELPCAYAVSGAEKFATSAVKLANALGFADSLVFGAETADIAQLIDIAQLLLTPKCDALIKGQ
ncbi:MAG: nucleotidyltransferase family protein, partial [Oscillospiraceae bacterium]